MDISGSPHYVAATRGDDESPVVELKGISKRFGPTVANDHVDFTVQAGEIHVLLGENGAGKTTLMNVLFGHLLPDEGEIMVRGEPAVIKTPHDAIALGIGMVHQHFSLVPKFTTAQNVVLGLEPATKLSFRNSDIEAAVQHRSDELNLPIDPSAVVGDLPVDLRQRVEILKAMYRGASVLIMDEPTALLGPEQISRLFHNLIQLREKRYSIILVTHKLAEVMQVADKVTVLQSGRKVLEVTRGEFDERSLALAMTGHEIGLLPDRATVESSHEHPPLEVRDLVVAVPDAQGENLVDRLSFSVGSGEILGIAGVEGNGQREVVETVTGLREPDSGEILLAGEDVTATDATMRRRRGLSVIPVDRHGLGLVLDMSLAENLMLSDIPAGRYDSHGLLQWKSIRGHAKQLLEEYDVRPPNPNLKAASLSGGNQQKVVLARELSRDPSVLVADNPTWGLDVDGITYVHRKLIEMRDLGCAILLLTLDLDELFILADRVMVLYRGRKMLERAASDIGEDDLALAMAGRAAQ